MRAADEGGDEAEHFLEDVPEQNQLEAVPIGKTVLMETGTAFVCAS